MKLTTDNWVGVINNEKTTEFYDSDNLLTAINNLDGDMRTMVSVDNDGMNIVIAGGPNACVCSVSLQDGRMFTLVNEKSINDENMIELKTGGQFGEYMAKYVCDKMRVMNIAKAIIEIGLNQENVIWESD